MSQAAGALSDDDDEDDEEWSGDDEEMGSGSGEEMSDDEMSDDEEMSEGDEEEEEKSEEAAPVPKRGAKRGAAAPPEAVAGKGGCGPVNIESSEDYTHEYALCSFWVCCLFVFLVESFARSKPLCSGQGGVAASNLWFSAASRSLHHIVIQLSAWFALKGIQLTCLMFWTHRCEACEACRRAWRSQGRG